MAKIEDPLSPGELPILLAHILAGAAGGAEADWAKAIGKIGRKHLAFDPTTNWAVTPTGTAAERDAINRAVEVVKAEHPYVTW